MSYFIKRQGIAALTIVTMLAMVLGAQVMTALAVSPPNIITYQGRVLDANGVPVSSSSLSMKFFLYTAITGGTCVWSNSSATCDSNTPASTTARTVTLTSGLFTENLGDTSLASPYAAIADSTFADNASIYLAVEIAGETLSPRKQMTAAPYALNADTLDGIDLSVIQLWEVGTNGSYENDAATIVGADAAFSYASGGVGDLRVADQLEVIGTSYFDGNVLPANAGTETLGSTSAEWGSVFIGDGTTGSPNGVVFGADQDFALSTRTSFSVEAMTWWTFAGAAGSTDIGMFTIGADANADGITANQEIFEIGKNGQNAATAGWTELFAVDEDGDVTLAGTLTSVVGNGNFEITAPDSGAFIFQNASGTDFYNHSLSTGDLTINTRILTIEDSSGNDLMTLTDAGSVGDMVVSGDLAVNGDDITSDGVLSLSATGYVRVGDSGTPTVFNADDDLYVQGRIEVGGASYFIGTMTAETIASNTDLNLNPSGGDVIITGGSTINIGGSGTTAVYNFIGDSITGASVTVDSDDDLYIEGSLEVDGTTDLDGNVSIADTDIAFDGASTTFTVTGAFTLNPGGTLSLGDGGDILNLNSTGFNATSTTFDVDATGAITVTSTVATGDGFALNTTDSGISLTVAGGEAGEDIDLTSNRHIVLTSTVGNATGITLDANDTAGGGVNILANTGGVAIGLTAAGPMSVDGDLLVIGGTADGDLANGDADLYVVGDFEVDTAARFDGAVTLGNEAGDTITVTGAFDSNGGVSIADTDIAFDGASTTFTVTGAFTLNPGGTLTLGDGGDILNINSAALNATSTTFDVDATGAITVTSTVATGNGITLDTTDSGIALTVAGAEAGEDLALTSNRHLILTSTVGNATGITLDANDTAGGGVNILANTGGVAIGLTAAGPMSVDGDLLVIGGTTDGTTATGDADLYVVGDFEVDGTTDLDGNLIIADTNIAFDGASTTFTTTGAFTLSATGTSSINTIGAGSTFSIYSSATTLGNNNGTVAVNSTVWDVASTGAINITNSSDVVGLTIAPSIATTTAITLSDTDIVSALSVGQNYIVFDTTRVYGSAAGTITWEDTSNNDLMTLTDNTDEGDLTVTGNFVADAVTGTAGAAFIVASPTGAYALTLNGGAGSSSAGGAIDINAGAGNAATNAGGAVTVDGGAGGAGSVAAASGAGGGITITAGTAGNDAGGGSGTAGAVLIVGGNPDTDTSSADGGDVTLRGGTGGSGGTSAGGDITLDAGSPTSGGIQGRIYLLSGNASSSQTASGAMEIVASSELFLGGTTINIGDEVNASNAINIGGVGTDRGSTISIATEATSADTISIGNANSSTSLTLSSGTFLLAATGITISNGSASITDEDAVQNAVTDVLTLSHTYGPGAGANGIGTGIVFRAEDAGNTEEQASIDLVMNDVTNNQEDSVIVLSTQNGGTIGEIVRFGSNGTDFEMDLSGTIEANLVNAISATAVCRTGASTSNEIFGTCTGAPTGDYAEQYPVAQGINYGDIVVPGVKKVTTTDGRTIVELVKSSAPYQGPVSGIVADNYGNFTSAGYNINEEDHPMPVALVGRVPVNVTNENGAIKVGDYLTTSSTPGHAMKATEVGRVIGMALADFDKASGQVMVQVNNGWFMGDIIASDGSSTVVTDKVVVAPLAAANVETPAVDSYGLALRGSAWDGAQAQAVEMMVKASVTDKDHYRLSVRNTTDTEVAYITNEGTMQIAGDMVISGKLYPSDRGTAQTEKYIYYDGSEGAGGDFMRTNAKGWSTGSYDFAEMFPSDEQLQPGEIVVFAGEGEKVKRSLSVGSGQIAGIVSTRPGFLAGENVVGAHPVALAGRVPTLVSAENGEIKVGDPLTTSSKPGYAMKATKVGMIVGYALEPLASGEKSILAFVSVGYWGGEATSTTPGTDNRASGFATGTNINYTALNMSGNIYVSGHEILSVGRIAGVSDVWSIEQDGTIKTEGVLGVITRSYTDEKVQTVAVTSPESVITLTGTATLKDGQAEVRFEAFAPEFNDVTALEAPIRVIVTPNGPVSLYVSEKDNNHFVVKQFAGEQVEVEFDWMVTAYRKGYEPVPVIASPAEPDEAISSAEIASSPAAPRNDGADALEELASPVSPDTTLVDPLADDEGGAQAEQPSEPQVEPVEAADEDAAEADLSPVQEAVTE